MESENEVSEEEALAYRKEVAEKIWNEEEIDPRPEETPEPEPEPEKEPEKEPEPEPKEDPPDPWHGTSPALKETLEKIDYRLKQTESRIGSIQNEAHAAKEVEVKDAPTEKQVEKSSESEEEWEELKESFPEWAKAIEGKQKQLSAELSEKLPEQIKTHVDAGLDAIRTEFEKRSMDSEARMLSRAHKDWKSTITTDGYRNWLSLQPQEVKSLVGSPYATDAIDVLDKYEASKSKKTPTEISEDRKERLKKSETTETTHKEKAPKSEADMTEAELRKKIANEVWAD